jgi:hypothetical protein
MKYGPRLTKNELVYIIDEYQNQLTPMIVLAEKFGKARQHIYKILRQAGVDTTKRRIPVSCTTCGVEVSRTKARIRRQLHHFCSWDCWDAFLKAGNGFPYIYSRMGQKIARSVVGQHFNLQEGNIVHHEDRNTLNNDLPNLRAFANQGDHLRYHRGFDVLPVWDGSKK